MRKHSRRPPARLALVLAISGLCIAVLGAEAPNPFTSSGGPPRISAPVSRGLALLAPLLHTMTDRLAALSREIRESRRPGPLLALALVSLLYGIFHALGPGHGKTIVSTFFLARDARLAQSLMAGYLIALVHAVSALGIVLSLFFIVRGLFSTGFESASRIVQTLSFGAIVVIGASMLIEKLRGGEHVHRGLFGRVHGHGPDHDHGHDHSRHHEAESGGAVTGRELLGIALASGIVPCPGASAVILVCLSLNVMFAGVVAVAMISLGMGITVSLVGAVSILVKRGVLKASRAARGGAATIARRIVEIAGASILLLFGLVFFIAQFA
jgi:nickel/cobalt transporter (NicO) family protein